MNLTYNFLISQTEELVRLCKVSNNLYNQALYIFRQALKNEDKWIRFFDMDKIMKSMPNLEGEINYRALRSQVSQQILRVLDSNITSYYKSIKDFKKYPDKYKAIPQLPSFRKRGSLFNLIYTNQSARIRNGKILLSKDLNINIPQWDKYKDRICNFKQIRIIPLKNSFKIEIIYTHEIKSLNLDNSKYASIDLGIDNLATMITENNTIVYSGKFLKSYNRYFNKKLARLQSIKDKQGIKGCTKRIEALYEKRNRYIEDVFHKYSRIIVDYLIRNRIGNLVVGYNSGWKQSVDMGKKNNQKFMQIPFARLTSYLKYKCEIAGIRYIETKESYTSKCDSLALEEIKKHNSYLGKRVKRGLFQSSTGVLINADVNGSMNILRKVVGDSDCINQIIDSGQLLCPIRYSNPFRIT